MALFRVKVKTINPKKKMHVNNNKKYIFKFLQKYKKFSCFVVILYTIGIIKTATVCKTYFFQENAKGWLVWTTPTELHVFPLLPTYVVNTQI